MSTKRWMALVFIFLIVGVCGLANAEEKCIHQWVRYDEEKHGVLPTEISEPVIAETYHLYIWRSPTKVCELCGVRDLGEYGSGARVPHAYKVADWKKNEIGDAVQITLACGVCEYVHVYDISLQALLDGTAESCLLGGPCKKGTPGYQYENGLVMYLVRRHPYPDDFYVGERESYTPQIYDPEAQTFLFASREFCPVCGRPQASNTYQPQVEYIESWNGLPIMTMEFFLTNGVPEGLPYQLIDQLRQEAGGAA